MDFKKLKDFEWVKPRVIELLQLESYHIVATLAMPDGALSIHYERNVKNWDVCLDIFVPYQVQGKDRRFYVQGGTPATDEEKEFFTELSYLTFEHRNERDEKCCQVVRDQLMMLIPDES